MWTEWTQILEAVLCTGGWHFAVKWRLTLNEEFPFSQFNLDVFFFFWGFWIIFICFRFQGKFGRIMSVVAKRMHARLLSLHLSVKNKDLFPFSANTNNAFTEFLGGILKLYPLPGWKLSIWPSSYQSWIRAAFCSFIYFCLVRIFPRMLENEWDMYIYCDIDKNGNLRPTSSSMRPSYFGFCQPDTGEIRVVSTLWNSNFDIKSMGWLATVISYMKSCSHVTNTGLSTFLWLLFWKFISNTLFIWFESQLLKAFWDKAVLSLSQVYTCVCTHRAFFSLYEPAFPVCNASRKVKMRAPSLFWKKKKKKKKKEKSQPQLSDRPVRKRILFERFLWIVTDLHKNQLDGCFDEIVQTQACF